MRADRLPAHDAPDVAVAAVLDRRLSTIASRPIVVALSGGGDSTALLLAAHAWARAHRRPLLVLSVDHQLQSPSRAWTDTCAALAGRLGVGFQGLAWTGEKPTQGLPAAARTARHRLLAEAARANGARVILLGHTADDVLEAQAMRAAGATTPAPREWSPSPVWPEGRGVFLLRPLLGLRREELRVWLRACGEAWIEDPANADPRYARSRARTALAGGGEPADVDEEAPPALAEACRLEPWGGLVIPRDALRTAAPDAAAQVLGLAAVCAGGGSRLPARAARDRLATRLAGPEVGLAAALAGARIEADASQVRIVREIGDARRQGLAPLELPAEEATVWDGRFEIAAAAPGLEVRPLAGLSRRLPAHQRRALADLPAAARPALPAIVARDGAVACPLLGEADVMAQSLVGERLRAAAGLIAREPEED